MSEALIFLNLASVLLMILSIIYVIINSKNENFAIRSKTGIIIFALIMFIIDRTISVISSTSFAEYMNASFIHYAGIISNLAVLPLAAIALIVLVHEL